MQYITQAITALGDSSLAKNITSRFAAIDSPVIDLSGYHYIFKLMQNFP